MTETYTIQSSALIVVNELNVPEPLVDNGRIDSTDGRGHFEIF